MCLVSQSIHPLSHPQCKLANTSIWGFQVSGGQIAKLNEECCLWTSIISVNFPANEGYLTRPGTRLRFALPNNYHWVNEYPEPLRLFLIQCKKPCHETARANGRKAERKWSGPPQALMVVSTVVEIKEMCTVPWLLVSLLGSRGMNICCILLPNGILQQRIAHIILSIIALWPKTRNWIQETHWAWSKGKRYICLLWIVKDSRWCIPSCI